MKIFLYCSYTSSRRGFCLTRLEGEELVAQSLMNTSDPGEQAVERFFSYDHFRILWQEFPSNPNLPIVTGVNGGIFGVRSLRGKIGDRDGVINFALLADRNELPILQSAAEKILGNLREFAAAVFAQLQIGGSCGYQTEGDGLRKLFDSICAEPSGAETQKLLRTPRDLLRFAVYVGDWEAVSDHMAPSLLWKIRPKQAISEAEYTNNGGYRW